MLVSEAVSTEDYIGFSEAVQEEKYNFRTISEIKKEILSLDLPTALQWGKSLIEGNTIQAAIGGVLLSISNAWEAEPNFLAKHIDLLASSESWQKREIAIELLKQALINSKTRFIPLFMELTVSTCIYKRRVAITTAKQVAMLKPKYNLLKSDVLALLTPFIFENDTFVTRIVVDTFANGFIKYCPQETLTWLNKLIPIITHNKHKIQLLRSISTQVPRQNLFDVLDIIIQFIYDDDMLVTFARQSALTSLAKDYPKQIGGWLEHNLHFEAVVDHWAELDIAGLIPSVCT